MEWLSKGYSRKVMIDGKILKLSEGLTLKNDAEGDTSDGSHTFEELYYHRMLLFSMVVGMFKERAWKSWLHDDGTMFKDYFIVGIETEEGQFSYHYHKDYWDMFDCKELNTAPEWDGHTASDITRLLSLLNNSSNILS